MRNILMLTVTLFLASPAFGQEKQNTNPDTGVEIEQQVELPVFRRSPPKISLPRALRLAASRMKKQNGISSRYYLAEAKYTLVNFEGNSFPCWRLLWIQADNQGSDEHDIWAYVFMDGRVSFSPVM